MKKLLFLMMSLAIAVSASANVKTLKAQPKMSPRSTAVKFERVPQLKTDKVMPGKFMKAAPNRAAGDVITTQPEGEMRIYTRAGEAITYSSTSGLQLTLQDGTMNIVFADNNKVYLKDPIYGMGTGAWVEGTISGNTITVPLGQFIYWSNSGYGLILTWGSTFFTTEIDEETGEEVEVLDFAADETVTEVTYTIDGNTITMNNCAGDVYNFDGSTGLSAIWDDDLSWQGFIEWNTVLTYSSTVEPGETFDPSSMITEQPEGELVEYVRSGDAIIYSGGSYYLDEQSGTAYIVYAPDGETVYLKNPISGLSSLNTWVKGTISGNKITVPLGQFISWNTSYSYGLILSWGSVNSSANYTANDAVTEITYTIDGNTISLDNCVGGPVADGFSGCTGLAAIWNDDLSWQGFIDWNTVYTFLEEAVPAVPADPEILEWSDSGKEDGYSNLYFNINTLDVNGVLMHENNMTYSIYVDDDELFTFDAATYAADNTTIFADGVDLTEIPYNVSDYDFFAHRCYFYRTNKGDNPMFQYRIGIQVHNTVNGVKNSSNIIYLEVTPPEPITPAVPADPVVTDWRDYGDESGYSRLAFTLPTVDVNGKDLDPENLSYSVYLDNDQLFTFEADTYDHDLQYTGDLTEIPYWIYSDGYDFYTGSIYFYRTNAEGYDRFFTWRIGLQVHNTVDGEKHSSNIVYLEVFEQPQEGKIGDVNGDDVVDIEDVTTLISKVLGNSPEPFIEENANVDGLGGIDIEDVTVLITMVLGNN